MNFEAQFETQEAHVGNSKLKIVAFSLATIFLICGILMAIFHPEAEFTWLVGEMKYYLGLFIIAIFCLFYALYKMGESRDEKYYFTSDGKLDLDTPRSYKKLNRHKILNLITRKGSIDEFAYDGEGNVYIKFRDGSELTSPLSDLTVSYSFDKNQFGGDLYINKMTITNPLGITYKVKYGFGLEDSEYNDIFMILSTAGTIKESKLGRLTRYLSKFKDAIDDFDFSDLVGSGIAAAAQMASSAIPRQKTADNNVIAFIKSRVYKEKKKKSWFKKITEYFWLTVGIVYILAVLIVNIAALPEIFGGADKDYDEYIEEVENDNVENDNDDEDIMWEEAGPSAEFLELAGDDYWVCHIKGKGEPFYLALIPEVGTGVFEGPDGTLYSLIIDEENDARTDFVCNVFNDEGWPVDMMIHIDTSYYDNVKGSIVGTEDETILHFTGRIK